MCTLPDAAEAVSCASMSKFPRVIITSLIDAIRLGSHEAKLLFPRLLQIVAQFPNTIDDFVTCVRSVYVY